MTAMVYMNKQGSQISIPLPKSNLTMELGPTTQITLQATQLPGTDNALADMLSLVFHYSQEWELHNPTLHSIFWQWATS